MGKRTHPAKERQSLDLRIVCDCYRRAGPLFVIVISLYPRTNAEARTVRNARAPPTHTKHTKHTKHTHTHTHTHKHTQHTGT